jgi:hypothetical protein
LHRGADEGAHLARKEKSDLAHSLIFPDPPQGRPIDGICLVGSMADDQKHTERESTPPGHFVSEDQRAQTARFLDELRKRIKRDKPEAEPKLGPPRRPR